MKSYGGKTADERRAERRAQLIAAARELFIARGYAGTSIRAVLREAGLQERYFAENFSGMDDLLAAVHDEVDAYFFDSLMRDVDRSDPPAHQRRTILTNYITAIEKHPAWARIKLIETVGVSALVDERRRQTQEKYATAAVAFMPVPRAGSTLDPHILARAFISGMNGIIIDWLTGTLDIDTDQVITHGNALFDGVLEALNARQETS
ncbi:TetR/AcrR family transcriptional regulator [Actinoplanes sp. TBRC 11911]|uniref:TetR/AcrR family transcriptional regulator n=1 Tax=Actinoplanes sp. TBRC 11911 TaxID=2729386 RepID=UPI00145F43AA|nr:TetR/AcrR family transcriptional regulator [Actinoplanes sp. TBRC 11911]NMO51951.1 TetR/AcrR family transcriptional regulator [Actinoplanes sp. TBRC 11911]